ncbi:hypothetical protein [Dielma fastidiosa]|uniref:Uncharacterized protein n=1 Tax=Dielma fastidiosa TaxID=1034346 RepID=A0A318KTR0_9FIRM|nr:hypothetical protein [Dielma fastidiosa]PXX81150.1 hypothetical protein DES51_102273 [Dielma fastidiosa]
MKKIISMAMSALLMFGLCTFSCTHVHTEECGENGINCKHECYHVTLLNDEHAPN